jgi:hypothetical protein
VGLCHGDVDAGLPRNALPREAAAAAADRAQSHGAHGGVRYILGAVRRGVHDFLHRGRARAGVDEYPHLVELRTRAETFGDDGERASLGLRERGELGAAIPRSLRERRAEG